MSVFTKASDGSYVMISKHPPGSGTWHWSLSISRRKHVEWGWRLWLRADRRLGQWHDYYRLPFGLTLAWSAQDWHKR